MAKNGDTINIMHISDIHCGIDGTKTPKYRQERKEVIEAFHRDFKKIPADWRPDIIAITGDLGWSGQDSDYEEFGEFLKKLLEETDLQPESVICCPGNHDKFLPKDQKFPASIKKGVTPRKGISKYYCVDDVWSNLEPLAGNFESFSRNLEKIGIASLNNSGIESTKYLYGCRTIKGIYFIVLNSAWLCDWREDEKCPDADKGHLLIDANIVCEILEKELPQLPIVAMYHHTREWFKASEIESPDGTPTAIDWINKGAHIILNGHIHDFRDDHSRRRLQYIAGTISSDDTYRSQCYLLRLHVNNDDLCMSFVEEGQYYSHWINKDVSWVFDEDFPPRYFNTEKQVKYLEEECNKKDKQITDLQKSVANAEACGDRLQKAFEKLRQYIDGLRQEYIEKADQCKKKKLEIEKKKAQIQDQMNISSDYVKDHEELESMLQEVIDLELGISELQTFLDDVWQSAMGDTLSDTEKMEQTKHLVKMLSHISAPPTEPDNN